MPTIEFDIKPKELTVDGKAYKNAITPANPHIPHFLRVAATMSIGYIAVKGNKVHLKHVGGNNYQLTFE